MRFNLRKFFPSIILATISDEQESPTTFKTVAGASIIVAIIERIGKADDGKPRICKINISDIVPPPIGTAVISNVESKDTPKIVKMFIFLPNK